MFALVYNDLKHYLSLVLSVDGNETGKYVIWETKHKNLCYLSVNEIYQLIDFN